MPARVAAKRGRRRERVAEREGEGRVPLQRPLRALGFPRGGVRRENGRKVSRDRGRARA